MAKLGSNKMNFRIRTKLLVGFFIVLAFVAIAGFLTNRSLVKIISQGDMIMEASSLATGVSENLSQPAQQIHQILLNSALTGRSQDADRLMALRGKFETYIETVPPQCQACHAKVFGGSQSPPGLDKLNDIKSRFEAFNNAGQRLLDYRELGDEEAINAAVDEFDKAANSLIEEIGSLSIMGERYQSFSKDRMEEYASMAMNLTRWGTFLALVIGLLLALTAASRISSALEEITDAARRIAEGKLGDDDMERKTNDEMGLLTDALNRMRQSLRNTIGGLTNSGEMVASASEELSGTVKDINDNVSSLTRRAESVATSTTEMSQTVLDIASNASNIATSAEGAMETANNGAVVVTQTLEEVREISIKVQESSELMTSLGQRSNQVGEIVNVINDIADQTNLLALNAAIEAARAGDQGRGFAVVADEVRKLAERTGKATTEIGQMIESIQSETGMAIDSMAESQGRVEKGTELAGHAEEALNRILDSVKGLMDMVQHIASSTEEMSATSEMISSELESIAMDSHKAGSSTTNISKAADDLLKLSKHLHSLSEHFEI